MRKRAGAVALFIWLLFALQTNGAGQEGAINGNKPASNSGILKYRVFSLRNISAKEGIQILTEALFSTQSAQEIENTSKITQLNDSNMLLINADSETLVKASNILELADSKEKYVVKAIMAADGANKLPKADAIAAEITGSGYPISIGTLLTLPGGTGFKAIIGVHDKKLIAIAPLAVMDKIVEIAGRNRSKDDNSGKTIPVAPDSSRGPKAEGSEPNALFNDLLTSLTDAENSQARDSRLTPKPNHSPKTTEDKKNKTRDSNDEAGLHSISEEGAGKTETKQDPCSPQNSSYEPTFDPNADETLELALPEKLDVITLLDLMGKYLNLNYVYDPKLVQGKEIYLKVQGPIKVRELYPLAESIMKFTGLVMSRKGNLVSIVPLENALDIDPIFVDGSPGQVQTGDVVVTRIFQLNYIDTTNAKALLEQMKVGAVTELQGMGTLIVTGYAYRMNRVEQLLEVIDKPGRPKQFKYRQLKYTMAKTLAPKVKQLVEQLGDISIAIANPQPATPTPTRRNPRQPAPQPTPAPSAEAAKSAVYLDADERTNRILMIGNEQELAVVEDLIDALDVAQQDLRTLRVYEIQHVDAQEVRKKLEELGVIGATKETTPTGRITSRAARNARRGEPGPDGAPPSPTPNPSGASGQTDEELPTEEMQVVVLESTNSLMVNASPEQHALVAAIIAYVDSESIEQAIPYVVYPLQNQPPEHIAEVLQKLIQEVVQDDGGKIQTIKKTDEDIIIVPDPSTFSLIVYASKKNQDWVANLIRTLDRRRPQVLIDVTLVEVTNIEAFDLDLQLASKFPVMESGGEMDVVGSVTTPFLNKTSTEAFSSPGTGVGQAFYSDRHIQALLTALESKNYGRVLAKPKILVNDGQRGSIRTTDTVSVKIESQIVPEQGNSQIVTSYQPYQAGISLEIQPNIGEGDLLLLIVRLDRTDFLTRSDISIPPDSRANTVDTIVTVPNNKTIILGGLLKLNQSKGNTKIPLLGDIPLLGGLFRSTSNTVNDSKLYVFVRANILRPEAGVTGLPELERISERNRAAFEGAENRFQKHEDWPGIKPKPVDPERVLDAE